MPGRSRRMPSAAPTDAPAAPATAALGSSEPAVQRITVQRGDTLSSIALDHLGSAARWPEIYRLNRRAIGRDPDHLAIGLSLVLPQAQVASSEGTPTLEAAGLGSAGSGDTSWASETAPPTSVTVRPGETLSLLAARHLEDPERWPEIYQLNRRVIGRDPDRLQVGITLVLPQSTGQAALASTSTTPAPSAPIPAPRPTAPTPAPTTSTPAPAPVTSTPAPSTAPTTAGTANSAPTQSQSAGADSGLKPWVEPSALASASAAAVAVCPADLRAYGSQNIPLLLRNAANARVTLPDQAAYILATAEHESGFGKPRFSRSESLVEDSNPFKQRRDGSFTARVHTNGQRVNAPTREALEIAYWDSAYGGRLGNERGTADAANFRGRGFAQLTGRSNYQRMSGILNSVGYSYELDGVTYGGNSGNPIDLVANPDHVNRVPDLAARILVEGSMRGTFTGRSLNRYITEEGTDFVNARRVINGTDRAADIAAIARRYAAALRDNSVWAAVFMPVNAPSRA